MKGAKGMQPDQTKLGEEKEEDSGNTQCKLYRLLLGKYADLINENEKRTIGEIKALVNADDLTIQSILSDFKPDDYSRQKHYLQTAKKVFEFVTYEIKYVDPKLNLNYWLTPKEIFTEKVADDEDLAVFLCSLLSGLGDENAEVVIAEIDDPVRPYTHAFVISDINDKFYILDPSQRHGFEKFSGKKEEVLSDYNFRGAKIKKFLYKFNHSNYEQFM